MYIYCGDIFITFFKWRYLKILEVYCNFIVYYACLNDSDSYAYIVRENKYMKRILPTFRRST